MKRYFQGCSGVHDDPLTIVVSQNIDIKHDTYARIFLHSFVGYLGSCVGRDCVEWLRKGGRVEVATRGGTQTRSYSDISQSWLATQTAREPSSLLGKRIVEAARQLLLKCSHSGADEVILVRGACQPRNAYLGPTSCDACAVYSFDRWPRVSMDSL